MFSFNAVMPILILIILGYILKRLNFASDEFFKTANSLVFRVFLPILLFYNVYEIKTLSAVNWRVIIFSFLCVFLLTAIGWLLSKAVASRRDQIGVLTQCAFRSNHAIIGIPLAQALGGTQAVAFASIMSAAVIPLFNLLAVFVLSYYAQSDKKPSFGDTIKRTFKNPLIISVAIGLVVIAARAFIPTDANGELAFSLERDCPFIFTAIVNASKVASPLSLVALGARFDFASVKGLFRQISLGVVLRLIVAPALSIGLAVVLSKYTSLINVSASEYPALVSVFGAPIAISGAVMVSEIGGDDQLSAQLIVWTSALSMVTIFITVFILRSLQLI